MNDEKKEKKLMDGYVGVKFKSLQRSTELPISVNDYYIQFKQNCDRLKNYNMTPENGGNVSIRHENGFIISASGANLGSIEKEELIFVEQCDVEDEFVIYHGEIKPSSESIMHWLIYKNYIETKAIIHAHDEFATRTELLSGEIEESEHEEPYGTVELANMAICTFKKAKRIIVLKNHGYVAIGPDIHSACDIVIDTHLHLVGKQKNR